MSDRMGRIVTYDRFDAQFFGMTESMAQKYGPQLHMLLESTYETIVDAGMQTSYFSYENDKTIN